MTAPGTCTVSGTIYTGDGEVAYYQTVEITIFDSTAGGLVLRKAWTVTTDLTGGFSFDAVQGCWCMLKSDYLLRDFQVPAEATYEVT